MGKESARIPASLAFPNESGLRLTWKICISKYEIMHINQNLL